ncbi:MAG: ATP-binding protein, partial [Chloroflexi bacterium]|nr:ATP-binding protein [Chloroflexota bacterium]
MSSSIDSLSGDPYYAVSSLLERPMSADSASDTQRVGSAGARVRFAAGQAALVGRADELEFLRAELEAAITGCGGRLVLISGDPGVGKTRLASEIGRYALERGGLFLEGTYLRDGTAPYGAWTEALAPALRSLDPDELASGFGPYGAELRQLFPEILETSGALLPAAPSPAEQRRRVFEGLVQLVTW